MDITLWNNWFLDCLEHSIDSTSRMLETVVEKARFFQHHNNGASFNERQTKIINRLLDGLNGTLTSEKWRFMRTPPDNKRIPKNGTFLFSEIILETSFLISYYHNKFR